MDITFRSVNHDPTRRFLAEMVTVVVVAALVAMAGVYWRTTDLLKRNALDAARSYADLVVATRFWNASHAGVWILKSPGTETNPYLIELGISADATTTDGRALTLRNPAAMTREISEVLKRDGGAYFRMTSARPINPGGAPDAWESASLQAFDAGATERWETTRSEGVEVLRYMRPLITDASCLPCHERQGYRIGDVRGAVSVFVPAADARDQAALNVALLGGFGAVATLVLAWIAFALVRRMREQLDRAQAALVEAATVDELTGLATRREAMQRLQTEIDRAARTADPLALVMIDIDHFKTVNDMYGHAAGDCVLAEVTRRIADTLRPYDVFGRVGGEEFLIVAPETGLEEAVSIAERARVAVSASPVHAGERHLTVTVSLGAALVDPTEQGALDRALARADDALYDAKESGRDRTGVR